MPLWALSGVIYGAVLLVAAATKPIARRTLVAALSAGYLLVAFGVGALPQVTLVVLVAPAVLLLVGYWLSGFFFREPQAWLERWLLRTDRQVFAAADLDQRLASSPRWILEFLEAAYVGDYVIVGLGAIAAACVSVEAASAYWTLVLTSELACYATLPWLRSRPPRALETPGALARRRPTLRRLNEAILDRASVQANTIPSGHVAGAAAAGLALLAVNVWMGTLVLVSAVLIAIAAIAGRYHYIVDCVAGVAVAGTCWIVVRSLA
jgi:hypothetical protein